VGRKLARRRALLQASLEGVVNVRSVWLCVHTPPVDTRTHELLFRPSPDPSPISFYFFRRYAPRTFLFLHKEAFTVELPTRFRSFRTHIPRPRKADAAFEASVMRTWVAGTVVARCLPEHCEEVTESEREREREWKVRKGTKLPRENERKCSYCAPPQRRSLRR
jgi:hypothetical protein